MATLLAQSEVFDDDDPPLTLYDVSTESYMSYTITMYATSEYLCWSFIPGLVTHTNPNCSSVLGSSLSKKMVLQLKYDSWCISVFNYALLTDICALHLCLPLQVSRIYALLLQKTSVQAPFPALLRTRNTNCCSVLGSSISKKMVLYMKSESRSIALFIDAILAAACVVAPLLSSW